MPRTLKAVLMLGLTQAISLSLKAQGLIVSMSFIIVLFWVDINFYNAKLKITWAKTKHSNTKI